MRVFVDSGVYMDYLQGKGVRLHVLKTFEELLEQGKFKLIFPNITKEEIYKGVPLDRGRYLKNQFSKFSIPPVPAGVEESEEYKQARGLLEEYNTKLEEVRRRSLEAVDEILENHIEKLIKKAEDIQEDQNILYAAQVRKLKKNPPGKNTDPLGDQIVWELLLQKCTDEDLTVIVHDEDWKYTDGNKTRLHPLLQKEWDMKNTGNKVKLFPSLAPFIESIAPGKLTKKDIESEKQSSTPPTYRGDVDREFIFFTPPNLGAVSSASPPSVSQWQPVTVVGSAGEIVQCYSCGRWVNRSDYYGFTPQGYGCKFCAET